MIYCTNNFEQLYIETGRSRERVDELSKEWKVVVMIEDEDSIKQARRYYDTVISELFGLFRS